MSAVTELKKLNEEFIQQKKELILKTRNLFDKALVELFDKYSNLESFGWNQYTPYFNDGDECIFRANIDYIDINGESYDDMDDVRETRWDSATRSQVPNPMFNADKANMIKEIKSILKSVDREFLKEAYGDHVEVVVTRQGSEVNDYEHD